MNQSATAKEPRPDAANLNSTRPRLGFLGTGWIGRSRLEAIAKSGVAEIAAVADPVCEMAIAAREIAPETQVVWGLEELLGLGLDGVVIATPSAMHAEQSIAALERGLAVFCQKPLGRNAPETEHVIVAARRADRLLGVDLSYRYLAGAERIRELIQSGELGRIYAVDLVFHNAYGPDKSWFYNPKQSGGGCVIDLGIHLIDLALWMLGFPKVEEVSSRLFAAGQPIQNPKSVVEDFASARIDLEGGSTVQLACSWKLPAGCDAVIAGCFYGTQGGACLRNLNGSFYDFTAERFRGTAREVLTLPGDAWPGRAAVAWAQALAEGKKFDPEIETLTEVATTLDRIYGRENA